MNTTDMIRILRKYKDHLPFDFDTFIISLSDGNIDALTYMSFLNKHDLAIHQRNALKPQSLTYYSHEFVDNNYIPTRMRFLRLSDTATYFEGFG